MTDSDERNVDGQRDHTQGTLLRDLALYTVARLGLIAAVTAILVLIGAPLVVALAVGVIVGFLLSIVLLKPLHARVGRGLAARNADRDAERERLRAQLRGEAE